MTELLRLLTNLLPAGPWVVFGDYYEQGPVYNGWDGDEDDTDCVCDPDAPQATYVLLPIDAAQDLFVEAIRRYGNGGLNPEDVGWEMARSLELGGDVA